MNLVDYIIATVIVLILGLSGWFVRRSRKKGEMCIGCPDNCACSQQNCNGSCKHCRETEEQ